MPDYGIRRNKEGYSDPTAYTAIRNIQKEERRVMELINVLKYIIDQSGFELTARIQLREKRTKKEFR
jgi:hypothetical protein